MAIGSTQRGNQLMVGNKSSIFRFEDADVREREFTFIKTGKF
jgi:hypothetical protein